jgi:hypothetical protein
VFIEKKDSVAIGEVAALRLVTGEEIIGKVVENSIGSITLTKPVVLQMQMVAPNQAGIGFAPFMVGTDEDSRFTIGLDKLIVHPMKARKDIAANYTQATTGIAVPQAPGIIR